MELSFKELKEVVDIQPYTVNGDNYEAWELYYKSTDYIHSRHKLLEHYVSYELMQPLEPNSVGVDIASDQSPFPNIMRSLGYQWYAQDLLYPEGISGNIVGGLASELPFSKNTIDVMTLHCSFEHFEGDEDILFLMNAQISLRPGGRIIILPLYTWTDYRLTAPQPSPNKGFARFYDKHELRERVINQVGLRKQVYDVYYQGKNQFRALVLEK